jgi:hypothetical protein
MNKPEGPIFMDFSTMLLEQLPINKVVQMANLAMNKLTLRDHGEIFHELDIDVSVDFRE